MTHSPLRRPISDIRIGDRHRKDMGDLAALAKSISEQGLLQPVGIYPDGDLVFGERRLLACRDHLGWTEIDVRIVDVTSRVEGEMHENEMRKQFTPSERVAIFRSIETIGQQAGPGRGNTKEKQIPLGESLLPKADKAAKLAGFAGRGTAYRAENVVKHGIPELVEAMDKGEVTITAAAQIATFPTTEQREHLAAAKSGQPKPKKKAKPTPPPAPPQKHIGQIMLERGRRAAAMPELTPEEKELPPPELADQQHPDYPEGVTYAHAWSQENGKVQLWPLVEKRKLQTVARWQETIGQLAQLDIAELDGLNPDQRALIEFSLRKVLNPIMSWLSKPSLKVIKE